MKLRFLASLVLLIGLALSPLGAARTSSALSPRQDVGVVLVDHFENATSANFVSGSMAYVGGPPGLGRAADFSGGSWVRYNVPNWYTGPWETSSGTIDIFVYPTAYGTHLADINWYATTTEPGSGHLFHLFILDDGHVRVGFWPSYGFDSASTIPLNRWTHIWVTWGAPGTRLYLNNVLDTSLPDRRVPGLSSMNYLYIPAWSVPNIGYVDELRIRSGWNEPEALRITTDATLPGGTVGQPYSAQLAAAGGLPPYAWSLSAGALPAGLSLDPASGLISGIPTSAGTFGFTVQVTDALNVSATQAFAAAPSPTSGTAGTAYSQPIVIDPAPGTGGTDPGVCTAYALVSGALPSGLTLDATTGVVSGTPTNGGAYAFAIGCTVSGGVNNGQTATKDFVITIYNPAPVIASLAPSSITAGGPPFVLTVHGQGFVLASVGRWNGADRATTYVSANQLEMQVTAADIAAPGAASVTVFNPQLAGDGGESNAAAFTILVPNQPPTVVVAPSYSVDEGSTVNLSASGTDPEGGPLSYAWDLDGDGVFETPGQEVTFSAASLDGPTTRIVTVRATDQGGLTAQASATVNVANVNPAVSTPVAPAEPVQVNTAINTTAAFVDPGRLDTHSASWSWDDGSSSAGVVQEVDGSGTALGSHTYTTPGVYEIGVTVTDKDGGTGHSTFQYVVIYDPTGGFVTGGGWINSPAGAYVADATLTGKANFGFVSKYKKGASVPTGQTEFQFKAAGLDFHSTSYQWLVVAGPKAQYKGLGKINGAGAYGFMLTAVDGQAKGGGGVDRFRIRIWDTATGAMVYDNQLGAADDAVPSTALGGGSIVVHK